jgi:RND family efflux transporter MFP subunit
VHAQCSRSGWGRHATFVALAAICLAVVPAASAQEMPASPVRYTEVREHDVHGTIRLPGRVAARSVSQVASEVQGRVEQFPGREGIAMRKGSTLLQLNTDELALRLDVASAQLQEAEARFELAQRILKRARELIVDEVIAELDMDTAISEFHAWEGRVAQYTAEVARIELDLKRSTIRAPFHGIVVDEWTELGEWISVGEAVVEFLSLEDLEVHVDVPERYFRNLNPDAVATVTFEALPGVEVAGTVRAIIPRADPQAHTFPIKLSIPNREGRIGVGMLARVSLPAGEAYRAIIVPKDALVAQGPQRFVYLINGDNTVSRTPVEAGDGFGAWIVVDGPLLAGARVVTRGNERLRPGQQVQGEPLEYALP